MIEGVLVFGLVILVGIALILAKLPLRWSLWLLGHHIMLDVAVTIFALVIHWGTMTGLMAAAVAGMMCSLVTSIARRVFGYRVSGQYHVGMVNLTAQILRERSRAKQPG